MCSSLVTRLVFIATQHSMARWALMITTVLHEVAEKVTTHHRTPQPYQLCMSDRTTPVIAIASNRRWTNWRRTEQSKEKKWNETQNALTLRLSSFISLRLSSLNFNVVSSTMSYRSSQECSPWTSPGYLPVLIRVWASVCRFVYAQCWCRGVCCLLCDEVFRLWLLFLIQRRFSIRF